VHPNQKQPFSERPVREPGTALYKYVKRLLLAGIEQGNWSPGTALPNESTLARMFDVSIGTLRRAVDELQAEQVLSREQGRGTFVQTHGQRRFFFQFLKIEPRGSWPREASPQLKSFPTVTCIHFSRDLADEMTAAALKIHPGETIFRIENILHINDAKVVHDSIALPAKRFRGLTEKRFVERVGTVYQFYQQEYSVTILKARERTRAVSANKTSARNLGVAVGSALLEIHRLALSFDEKVVEYRISTVNSAAHDYVTGVGEAANPSL
jgi:GntR family transcriptional regulator